METQEEVDRQLPAGVAELFSRIDRGWKELHDAVARCDRTKWEMRPEGAWSIKDHLAHLSAWEDYLCGYHLGDQPEHEAMGIDELTYRTLDQDGLNALLYRRNRDRPLADVEADLGRSHAQVLDRLHAIGFDSLLAPRYPDDPEAGPRLRWVASNTYEHYEEHRVAIERLAREANPAGD